MPVGVKDMTKKREETVLVDPRKPPGVSRFSRKKAIESAQVDTVNVNIAVKNTGDLSEEEMCQQLLIGGFVQSYVDFYHLTHRIDPNAGEGSVQKIETPLEDLIFIRDNLVQAESSRRQGQTKGVYVAYSKLAGFYSDLLDWRTSIFFQEKYLEVSQLTGDTRAEMIANHELGLIYQKMSDFDTGRKFHERQEEIAIIVDIPEEIGKANSELYKVYMILAQKFENDGSTELALDMYLKCLDASIKSWDKGGEGEVNGKIGSLLIDSGRVAESIPYLQQQSEISAEIGFAEGRCRACSSLALAYDFLDKPDKALHELSLVHTISEQAGDAALQCQACKSLGTLYSKVGKFEEAVDALQQHFQLLKSILSKNPNVNTSAETHSITFTADDLDLARAYVGISKGNMMMGAYVMAVQSNLSDLLDWKLTRLEIPLIL